MATYPERDNTSILDFATDLEGAELFISKVNGDPALVGLPIPLSIGGSVTVAADGVVSYDDAGLPLLPEGARRYDGIIVAISDGVNEIEAPVSLEFFGGSVITAPAVLFGAMTRAGAGGVPVTGTAVVEGDSEGHFTVENGYLVPSVEGQGALEDNYLLTLDDGESVLVRTVPRRLDVRDADELAVAMSAAEALNPETDYEVVLRDNSWIGSAASPVIIRDIRMDGSLEDPNAAQPSSAFDPGAVPAFMGGSVTLRPETPGQAGFVGPVTLEECNRVRFFGLGFTLAADDSAPLSFDHGNGVSFTGPAGNLVQLTITGTGAQPDAVILQDCRFESDPAKAPGHWAHGITATGLQTLIVQDCRFARLASGVQSQSVPRTLLLRNDFTQYLGAASALSAGPAAETRIVGNMYRLPADTAQFAGRLASAITLSGASPINALIHQNRIYAPLPGRAASTGGIIRASAGILAEGGAVDGEISHNFILASGESGLDIAQGDYLQIRNNTIIPDTISQPAPAGSAALRLGPSSEGIIQGA